MGIRLLNKLLQDKCNRSTLHQINLRYIENKTITVDIYNYLYRFKGDNRLIENLFVMCSIFRKYNISPIFIYDGKAPETKYDTIIERQHEKNINREKYNNLLKQSRGASKHFSQTSELARLRRSCSSLTKDDIEKTKQLIKVYGMSFIQCVGESDPLCVEMVKKNKAYACLSDDMDMIGYGCPRVMRYLSLVKETVVMYNYKNILKDLNISEENFLELIILAGTDYGKFKKNIFLWYKDYIDFKKSNKHYDFIEYLLEINNLTNEEVIELEKIKTIYNPVDTLEQYPFQSFKTKNIIWGELKNILIKDNFMFPPNFAY